MKLLPGRLAEKMKSILSGHPFHRLSDSDDSPNVSPVAEINSEEEVIDKPVFRLGMLQRDSIELARPRMEASPRSPLVYRDEDICEDFPGVKKRRTSIRDSLEKAAKIIFALGAGTTESDKKNSRHPVAKARPTSLISTISSTFRLTTNTPTLFARFCELPYEIQYEIWMLLIRQHFPSEGEFGRAYCDEEAWYIPGCGTFSYKTIHDPRHPQRATIYGCHRRPPLEVRTLLRACRMSREATLRYWYRILLKEGENACGDEFHHGPWVKEVILDQIESLSSPIPLKLKN